MGPRREMNNFAFRKTRLAHIACLDPASAHQTTRVQTLRVLAAHNTRKSSRLYEVIDGNDFFSCPVDRSCRSTMNVVFRLPTEALEQRFVAEAAAAGMSGLKGHRSVGGLRASIYNAAPYAWADTLAQFMEAFAAQHG